MTSFERPSRQRSSRRSRRAGAVRVAIAALLAVVAFLVGVAFSRALDEWPTSGDPVTTIQTLEPRPQEAPSDTVTETVTQP